MVNVAQTHAKGGDAKAFVFRRCKDGSLRLPYAAGTVPSRGPCAPMLGQLP